MKPKNCGRRMSYIDSNLLAGERVVYRTRLHWLLFMGPVLFTAVVLLPLAWFLDNGTWSRFAWITLALGLLVLLATFIKRQSSDFAVTNKRAMMKVGVFSTRSVELLLLSRRAMKYTLAVLSSRPGQDDPPRRRRLGQRRDCFVPAYATRNREPVAQALFRRPLGGLGRSGSPGPTTGFFPQTWWCRSRRWRVNC